MSEPRIGRVLVASLHQSIADLLPTRLEFYENWLNVSGLRDGTIGLAPLSAVLSFLRTEGEAYNLITARAGEYAAAWTVETWRRSSVALFAPCRPACAPARRSEPRAAWCARPIRGLAAITRVRRGVGSVDLRGSLFCEVRETSMVPLCGFYAAAIQRVLTLLDVPADVRVNSAARRARHEGCLLSVTLNGRASDTAVAA